ncbi:respiratory chain complex I subunit 1 family protein [Campylobacter geochelonis]|uniref:Hydrogenase-4 component C n=1 Tax=Campylobacter geochelonis TaxID=1780362 RepID=A0A128EDL1_9BACT|nr:NADH-quinone oxidoreductase subunit H [Campylobacter geochelonis]QKF72145.1 hydrogenase-4, transmembrane adaptor [Campylobacter geochelonis]CZE46637.1 hydrogenase-4 component C [Campylobacter geochelonis]
MSVIFLMFLQLLAILLIAPLFDGIARKLRARFQSRVGCSIYQSYLDVFKLIKRGRTYPECSGFIFKITPYLMFAIISFMVLAMPIGYGVSPTSIKISDILLIIYLGALFRFVFAIASSQSGNALAGIGASREGMVGIYVEPTLILCLVVVMLKTQTTSLVEINALVSSGAYGYTTPSFAIASIAFLWAMYVEMGRKPYDLAEAEQELQEGVIGEYSGRDLAIIKVALMLKQFAMIAFFISIFEPWNFSNPILAILVFIIEAGAMYVLAIFIDNFGPRYKIELGAKTSSLIAFGISLIAVMLYVIGA